MSMSGRTRREEERINDFFTGRGRHGVLNVGNSCFASSVIQLLAHVPVLLKAVVKLGKARQESTRSRIDDNDRVESVNNERVDTESQDSQDSVAALLADLFLQQILNTGKECLDPRRLLRALARHPACSGELREQLSHRLQGDAQEFLTSLVDSLVHDVSVKLTPDAFADKWPQLALPSALDATAVPLETFMNRAWVDGHARMVSDFSCLRSSIVHGQLLLETICTSCKARHPASDVFVTLTIDLQPATSDGKEEANDSGLDRVDLADCLRRCFSTEVLSGSGWKCEHCKQVPQQALRTCSLWRLPRVLLVCIKRFDPCNRWYGKRRTRVSLPRHISLAGVVAEQRKVQEPAILPTYRLLSVVCHHGSASYGHYTAMFRDSLLDDWYQCDDDSVRKVASLAELDDDTSYILAYEQFTPRGG